MEQKEIKKPLTVVREEFKQQLADLINNSGLYAFMVEPILEEFVMESKRAIQLQYQQDKQRYDTAIENSKANEDLE
jgi:hypothetical protein